jgi:hypothetical protein
MRLEEARTVRTRDMHQDIREPLRMRHGGQPPGDAKAAVAKRNRRDVRW